MDDRDPDDALFRAALGRIAGPEPDAYAALAALHRAPGRAAHRPTGPRLAVLAAAAAVVVALLAAVNHRGSGPDPGPVASTGATIRRPATTAPATAPTSLPIRSAVTEAAPTTTAVPTSAPAAEEPGVDGSVPAGADGPDAGTAAESTTADGGGRGPGASPASTRPTGVVTSPPATATGSGGSAPAPTSATAPAMSAPSPTRTIAVTGGSVTVTVTGGAFGRPTVKVDPGWEAEVRKADATRIEVRFKADGNDVTARLTLQADGQIAVTQSHGG